MSVMEIVELVGIIITGLGLIVSIIKLVMNIKWGEIKKFIEEQMVIAEQSGKSGKEKLEYVLRVCYEKYGTTFIKKEKEIEKYIEECIDFSKKINKK